ncbi:MAG: DeoR/GlpR family DNA-binding transcription regulator [Verrucomicrobia bacterium]|nr:DeoR/GlpR family DNA-binding transcription regulator [Verrucomicrobiota bacterium]
MIPALRHKRLPGAARLQAIRDQLARTSSLSISEISEKLGVSEMTIRRDLATLEKSSDVRRTHGGAVVAERMVFEFSYAVRQRERIKEKQEIAAAARELVQPGQRVILDTGTTTLQLATLLKDCNGVTVITPSLAVASELQFCENLTVILLGGMIHRGSPDLTGPVTEHCLELLSADWAFQGAEAIGSDGSIYNVDLQLAQVDRKMRTKATCSCLLADSTKLGQTALVKNGNLKDFDIFITDQGISGEHLLLARKMAGKVIITQATKKQIKHQTKQP